MPVTLPPPAKLVSCQREIVSNQTFFCTPSLAGVPRRHAFSLVELSIVLVILGLLAGGILTGQSLIRAAELRSVTTQYSAFLTATRTFEDKYFAIPGDMINATDFWGAMSSGSCPNATGGTGTETCNGNGDGDITASGSALSSNEVFTFWQHLVNAGLIEGSYTGISGPTRNSSSIIGINVPATKLANGGWYATTTRNHAGDSVNYALDYGGYLSIGASYPSFPPINPLLSPEEAWSIDKKIDDGKPAYGRVIAGYWNGQCAEADDGSNANNDLNASYKLDDPNTRCILKFVKIY